MQPGRARVLDDDVAEFKDFVDRNTYLKKARISELTGGVDDGEKQTVDKGNSTAETSGVKKLDGTRDKWSMKRHL